LIRLQGARPIYSLLLAAALGLACATRAPLRIGTSGDYAPFSRDGRGFDVTLGERLAERLGARVVWVRFRWPELEASLRAGRFDVAMSGVTWRPDRALVGSMSRAVASGGPCVIGHEPAARVAVNRGGALERWARTAFEGAEILALDDNTSLPARLAAGEVDAIVTDSFELASFLRPGDPHRCEPPRDRKVYWIGPQRPELRAAIDAFLVEEEPWIQRERARWFGAPSGWTALDHVIDLIARRLALMPGLGTWKRAHGMAVSDPAREARVLEAVEAAARARGLDPLAVRALFELQIELARGLQERPAGDARPLPLPAARALIGELGSEIVAGIAALSGPLRPGPATLAPLGEWLDPEQVARLVAALEAAAPR